MELKRGNDVLRDNGEVILSSECTMDPYPPRRYAFMSDTAPSNKFIDMVRGVDLLYHESTFLEDKKARAKETMHSTAKDAAKFASEAKVKELVLGHFSSRYTDVRGFEKEASEYFDNITLAQDGLSIKVK